MGLFFLGIKKNYFVNVMKKEISISGLKLLFSINRISNQNGKLIILNYHQVSNHFDPRYNNLGTWNKIDLFNKKPLNLK